MTNSILRNINFRPEVYELIQGECEVRRNGGKGFSLTLNQIVLEFFESRTPAMAVQVSQLGMPVIVFPDPCAEKE